VKHPYTKTYFDKRDSNVDASEWLVIEKNIKSLYSVLEISCGTGKLLRYLKYRHKRVVGCDISEYAISVAKNVGVPVVVCDAQYLPFRDKVFSTSVSQHLIEHTEKPLQTLKESMRVSRKKVVHIVPGHPCDDPTHVKNYYKYDELKKLADELGCRYTLTDDGKTNPLLDLDWLLVLHLR